MEKYRMKEQMMQRWRGGARKLYKKLRKYSKFMMAAYIFVKKIFFNITLDSKWVSTS